MEKQQLIPHLFRTEYRKIVSVLAKRFGFDHLETAEDIASDTFLAAAQTWPLNGLPENPVAWLYRVASNKAKNLLVRDQLFKGKVSKALKTPETSDTTPDIDLTPQNIEDSQLQMMFAICHPSISTEAQIGLSLRILCGFGIDEIADAFLTSRDTINKRLFRARERLREEKIPIEMPGQDEIGRRLDTVLATIYLLFNEGYYSVNSDTTLRKDLCLEAMRLCHMLTANAATGKPEANALLALMCFHASRFEARVDSEGETVLYDDQDESLWNDELIRRGAFYLHRSTESGQLSRYHIEATIAFWSTHKTDSREKWENILQLYNRLLQIHYSPVAALNRTYALARADGKHAALAEAEKLRLVGNHFYFVLLGELWTGIDNERALGHFREALALARSLSDKRTIQRKIDRL
jgi:RNA polymerase sigma-70 factor (ECF subfamily)